MDLHDPFYDLFPRRSFPSIEPGRTALLTIDLQYLDAHEDGWIGRIAKAAGQPEIMRERWDNINGILPQRPALPGRLPGGRRGSHPCPGGISHR